MPQLDLDFARLQPYIQKISGRDYLTVAGRVVAAHDIGQFIGEETECQTTDTHYRCKSTVRVLNTHLPDWQNLPDGIRVSTYTGWAETPIPTREMLTKAAGNKRTPPEVASPIEVTATSSLGRALGNAGFGVLESIATFEEVKLAVGRGPERPPTEKQKTMLMTLANRAGIATEPATLAEWLQTQRQLVLKNLSSHEVSELIDEFKALPVQDGKESIAY